MKRETRRGKSQRGQKGYSMREELGGGGENYGLVGKGVYIEGDIII